MLEVYHFIDSNENELTYQTMNPIIAREYAREHGLLLVAYKYEFSESEPLEDFREES